MTEAQIAERVANAKLEEREWWMAEVQKPDGRVVLRVQMEKAVIEERKACAEVVRQLHDQILERK